jgi:hypothetical protein
MRHLTSDRAAQEYEAPVGFLNVVNRMKSLTEGMPSQCQKPIQSQEFKTVCSNKFGIIRLQREVVNVAS